MSGLTSSRSLRPKIRPREGGAFKREPAQGDLRLRRNHPGTPSGRTKSSDLLASQKLRWMTSSMRTPCSAGDLRSSTTSNSMTSSPTRFWNGERWLTLLEVPEDGISTPGTEDG